MQSVTWGEGFLDSWFPLGIVEGGLGYTWPSLLLPLCSGSLLVVFGDSHAVLWIEPELVICQASNLYSQFYPLVAWACALEGKRNWFWSFDEERRTKPFILAIPTSGDASTGIIWEAESSPSRSVLVRSSSPRKTQCQLQVGSEIPTPKTAKMSGFHHKKRNQKVVNVHSEPPLGIQRTAHHKASSWGRSGRTWPLMNRFEQ